MKYLILFLLMCPDARSEEKVEKVKSSISTVTKDRKNILDIPTHIPDLEWDPKGIRLISRESGTKQKYAVLMKGKLLKHKIESFTYQVDGYDAQLIKVSKDQFDVEIPLEKSPAIIRLWLEVSEGKGVHIYSDELHVRSEMVPSASEDKHANY